MKNSFSKKFKPYEISKEKIKKIIGGTNSEANSSGSGNIRGVAFNGFPQTRS